MLRLTCICCVCCAVQNVVAVGAGIIEGCGYGDNTKAAVIRIGLMEMVQFCKDYYAGTCDKRHFTLVRVIINL